MCNCCAATLNVASSSFTSRLWWFESQQHATYVADLAFFYGLFLPLSTFERGQQKSILCHCYYYYNVCLTVMLSFVAFAVLPLKLQRSSTSTYASRRLKANLHMFEITFFFIINFLYFFWLFFSHADNICQPATYNLQHFVCQKVSFHCRLVCVLRN